MTQGQLDAEVDAARTLDKRAVARLVSRFEDTRVDAAAARGHALARLDAAGPRHGRVIGVTGTPGVGKSTLLGELAIRLIAAAPARAVAVLAVDPSSPVSGGALLGDRTRVRFPAAERRLFFRSQASAGELGGVAPATFQVCRLLTRLFDVVFVETVGIGQSEIEIVRVADRTYLMVQPLGGDHVQFMKAGIMEMPDAFVVAKTDVGDAAAATFHALRSSLRMVRSGAEPPLLGVSARTGAGVDALCADILAAPAGPGVDSRSAHFLERWVRDEYGRRGLVALAAAGGAASLLATHRGFEGAQLAFASSAR